MKKLVVFMVALIAAVMSQAASLDWMYGASVSDSGQTVYVLLGTEAVTEWESVDALSAAAVDSGKVARAGRVYNASGIAASSAITKDSASIYYVIVAADGGSFSVTSVSDMKGSVYDPAAQESTPGANESLSSANITVAGKSFGGGSGDVPEPTSGLLLLVGGAALALRRKQK